MRNGGRYYKYLASTGKSGAEVSDRWLGKFMGCRKRRRTRSPAPQHVNANWIHTSARLKRVSNPALAVGVLVSSRVLGLGLCRSRAVSLCLSGWSHFLADLKVAAWRCWCCSIWGRRVGLDHSPACGSREPPVPLMLILFISDIIGMNQIYSWRIGRQWIRCRRAGKTEPLFETRGFSQFAPRSISRFVADKAGVEFLRNCNPIAQRIAASQSVAEGWLAGDWAIDNNDSVCGDRTGWGRSILPGRHRFSACSSRFVELSAAGFGIYWGRGWARRPMNQVVRNSHFHDWGNLMMAWSCWGLLCW